MKLHLFVSLCLLSMIPCYHAALKVCTTGPSQSTRSFGFVQASSQLNGNDNYVYVSFVLDVQSSSSVTNSLDCGSQFSESGIQQVEAAIWALQTYNKRYPSSISVGGLILNSCGSSPLAVQQISNLEQCETLYGSTSTSRVEPGRVYAYIGFNNNNAAEFSLNLMNGLKKSAITFSISSLEFTKAMYPYMTNISPVDERELLGYVQMLISSGVKYVQIVRSSSSRYNILTTFLLSKLTSAGICVANNVEFSSSVATLSVGSFKSVRPVFLLLSTADLSSFISQVKSSSSSLNGYFSWMLLSEHDNKISVTGNEEILAGTLVMAPFENAVTDFDTYFKNLYPANSTHSKKNPWFDDFWMSKFSCNLPGKTGHSSDCGSYSDPNNLKTSSIDISAYRVIIAVDLFVQGLEIARSEKCGSTPGLCGSFRNEDLRFQLLNSAFYKVNSTGFQLDSSSGVLKSFTFKVKNYQKNFPGYSWVEIRTWSNTGLNTILTHSVAAYGTDGRLTSFSSSCDSSCLSVCSGTTTASSSTASTIVTSTQQNTTLSVTTAKFKKQYWVYALLVCASLGVLLTVFFMIYILFKVLSLPKDLKNFNTLWLGEILLCTILIGYLLLFAWCTWPTPAFCGVIRFMVGVIYASVFAILLIKLLLLFASAHNSVLSSAYQVLLYVFAISVQLAISAEWLILVPAEVQMVNNEPLCNHTFEDHLKSLVYCMALILLCTIVAVRAHNIGKNNREATFVGLTVGLSIPIWIAWTLVGGLNNSSDFKDGSTAYGLFINLTLVLLMVFLPKVYQLQTLSIDDDDDEDFDDETTKDPIYVWAPPSIAGDPIYVAPSMAAAPNYSPNGYSDLFFAQTPRKTKSVAGDNFQFAPDLQKPVSTKSRKAYSELNFDVHDGRPGKPKLAAPVEIGYL